MIKLIAMDLDGTLLNDDKEITGYTETILKEAKNKGFYVVLCTGRPLASIHHYLEQLSLFDDNDYSITFNGGYVQHNISGEIIASFLLEFQDILKIIEVIEQYPCQYDIVSGSKIYAPSEQPQTFYEELNHRLPVLKVDNWDNHIQYNKVVVTAEPEVLDKIVPPLQNLLEDSYYLVRTMPQLFEIAHPMVSKENGLKQLCYYLNLTMDEVIAFGDAANDIGMLKEVGCGVAMSNAMDDVKKVSCYTTLTNNDEGVAKAIERLLFEGES